MEALVERAVASAHAERTRHEGVPSSVHTDRAMATAAYTIPFSSTTDSTTRAAYWILRVGAALCFIGHGAFGFITKATWIPYFGFVGIPDFAALRLMPLVGSVDMIAAIVVLLSPRAIALLYMTVWAIWTALLRPLTGESGWEAVERAGNYGVPLALLLMTFAPRSPMHWWRTRLAPHTVAMGVARASSVLRATTVAVLIGHGALGVLGSASQVSLYDSIGWTSSMELFGWFEVALAVAISIRPAVGLLLFAAAWKLGTESLWIASGAPVWEFVERTGSVAAPLALAVLRMSRQRG
jgi:hypothetical protein